MNDMKNMKRVFMIVLALMFGGLFLPGCVYVRNLSGWSGIMEGDFKFNIGTPTYEEKGYEVFDVDEEGILKISADNIKLNIEGSQASQIQVDYAKQVFGKNIAQGEAQRVMDEMSINFEEQNNEVYIKTSMGKNLNRGINISKRLIALNVKVPIDMKIMIDSDNGAIKIQNVAGDIDIESDNAAVELIDVSGNIKIDSDNGAIRLTSPSTGNLSLESDNGLIDVSLSKLAGDSYNIRTDNGMIHLTLSQDIAVDLEVTVNNGKVESSFPLERKGYIYTGSLGGGGGPRIRISTDNGMISIEKDKQE